MDNFHKLIEGFHNFKQTYFLKESTTVQNKFERLT